MITTPISTELVRGAAELESTQRGVLPHRLPSWVRSRFPDPQLAMVERQPSGVRVVCRTSATVVELDVHASRFAHLGTERPRGHCDLLIDGDPAASLPLISGDLTEINPKTGQLHPRAGDREVLRFAGLPAHDKKVELWLPHNESVELLELRTDRPARPDHADRPRWIHHGSSISQGSNAASPTSIWPAVAARTLGMDLHNLGFGGSALLDPFVARVIRDSGRADLISLKIGINLANADLMRLRALAPAVHGYLDTIRDGHPDTPLVLASPVLCPIHEDTPGPGAFDPASLGTDQVRFVATGAQDQGPPKLTLRSIREELASVVAVRDDPHLHLLDGTTLYGEADAVRLPLPDSLHPDTETHRLIGERFASVVSTL